MISESTPSQNKALIYLLSAIFLVLLNLIIFGLKGIYDYNNLDANLTVLLWTIFQIFTVLIILYIGFRRYERFKKRAIISSFIVYGISALAASAYTIIQSHFFCSTECGWAILVIPTTFVLGLYFAVVSILISLSIYHVRKSYVHIIILSIMFIITIILYAPSLLEGCAVYDYTCRLDYVVEKAVSERNPLICRTFNGFAEDRCYNLYSVQAIDFSACDYAFHSDECRKDTAVAAKDIRLCEAIQDEIYKDSCFEGVAESLGDIGLCEKLQRPDKGECYQKVAYATLNPEICRELLDSNVYCVRGVAARARNPSICEGYLDHRPSIDDCKSYIERGEIPLY